jgi:hypothetical protein
MRDKTTDESRFAALDERISVLERLVLRFGLVDADAAIAGPQSARKRLTVGQAILQVMKENDRNLTTPEIEVMAGRLLGRPLSKQSVDRYLTTAARSNEVERVAKGTYRHPDRAMR